MAGPSASDPAEAPQGGFVLDETQNESLPTVFAPAPAADAKTWQDYGYEVVSANANLLPLGSGTAADPYIIITAEQLAGSPIRQT